MQRIKGIFLLILIVSINCSSCKEKSLSNPDQQDQVVDSTALYGDKNFVLPKLSGKAMEAVEKWSVFDDFEKEAGSFNYKSLEQMRPIVQRLIAHADSLQSNIPLELLTNPIYSRLIVLSSRSQLLNQELGKSRLDSASIQMNIVELNNALTNFYVQINEKYQKELIDEQRREDEEKELEKQKRFLDSVYQAELQDKNNR